jgi:hypothetical protein
MAKHIAGRLFAAYHVRHGRRGCFFYLGQKGIHGVAIV